MGLLSDRLKMTINVVRIKKQHTRHSWVRHWCFHCIFDILVFYYFSDPLQYRIFLFYVINKQKAKLPCEAELHRLLNLPLHSPMPEKNKHSNKINQSKFKN